MSDLPVFHAQKRRKLNIKHASEDSEAVVAEAEEPSTIVRAKRYSKPNAGGVRFSNGPRQVFEDEQEIPGPLSTIDGHVANTASGLSSRFVGAASSASSASKNHNAHYTDHTSIHERFQNTTPIAREGDTLSLKILSRDTSETDNEDEPIHKNEDENMVDTNPARQQLSEVDIFSMSTGRPPTKTKPTGQRKKRPRLGRDGKPYKPRHRRGPDPDVLERSALVDQVFHEHGLGTYNVSQLVLKTTDPATSGRGTNETADERVASEFQQQFLDAVAERQERQRKQQKQSETNVSSGQGPRLGGSRSARAKMQATQEAGEVRT